MSATAWPYPRHIAHRGAGRLAPENTIVALDTGWRHGYRMFEFDAKLTADGKVVLMHDDTLERTTDGVGPIATRTWEEVLLLDAGYWHSAAMAGERVPDLDRTADWLIERGAFANIEIKPCRGRDVETGVAVALAATRCWAGIDPPPLLSSFSTEALAAARQSAPDLPRGLLFTRPPADCVEQALALECVSLHVDWRAVEDALLRATREAGLRLICYTVNDPAEAERLRGLGVDGLITDAVDRIEPID